MHARAPIRHRVYELVYILSPSTTPASAAKLAETVKETIAGKQGRILKVELWGIRRLAYRIGGKDQGIYYFVRFVAPQGTVEEIERRMKITDFVLRFLTVKLDGAEVDPASFTVEAAETEFKGIDEILANLSAAPPEPAATETPAAAAAQVPAAAAPEAPVADKGHAAIAEDQDDEEDDEE